MSQDSRCRCTSEIAHECGRNEIDDYPIRRAPKVAETRLVLKRVHRKPLMPQRLSHPYVDMFAKITNRRPRRGLEHHGYDSGHHADHGLRFRTYTPADREIESHLGTLGAKPTHQERTRGSDHRRATHPQRPR